MTRVPQLPLRVVVSWLCVTIAGIGMLGAPATAATRSQLSSGQSLADGAALTSPNGSYTLRMQTDGNLVEYHGSSVLFATDTGGQPGNSAVMQTDGNFVVYGSAHQVRFNTSTEDHSGSRLDLQDDGNLVIYDSGGQPVWARSWLQSTTGAQAYAKTFFARYGWSVSVQFPYLNDVWGNIESGWRWNVCNGGGLYPSCNYSGSAYGIPQADPGSTMAAYNPDWATDGLTQVAWGLNYIHATYGTPQGAYNQEEHGCGSPPCGYIVGAPAPSIGSTS